MTLRPIFFCVALVLTLGSTGCRLNPPDGVSDIRIESEPTGALLTLDGREVGRTPFTWSNPARGLHLVQFAKEGFETVDRVVTVSADGPRGVDATLPRAFGLVLFQSVPAGAEVSVGGIFRGKTPFLATDIPLGGYKVAFTLEGYDPREMELSIPDRSPQLCQMNMRSIYTTLRVDSRPPGAAVLLDGVHKGQTPCEVGDVLLGTHTLKLLKEGYRDYQGQIQVAPTGPQPMTFQLEERFAVLDVVSAPAEARVTVNDAFKGRTPLQVTALRDGSYAVVIEKPGFEKIMRTVEIRKNQDAKLDVTLEKATGLLSLTIVPSGCSVVVDGELKGVSADGPFVLEVSPGAYKVEVSKARHKPQSFKLDVATRKTASREVSLQRIWVKDTVLLLKDNRVVECMLVAKYPNGAVKVESGPGIVQEFSADEIQSITPLKP